MRLEVAARHRAGGFSLDAEIASDAAVVALFGPSGAGKTTILNAIAGLIRPDEARIAVDGRLLTDTAKRHFVPVHRRRIGYVFQDARLFPHLTVRQNLTYGRWFAPRPERYAAFDEVVDILALASLVGRKPQDLSGGEKQRVAIGRALLASPRLLLLDEPLASLDEARKAETLPYIERLRDELAIPILYVSHAMEEVRRLKAEVVHLAQGRVVRPAIEATARDG